MPAIGINQNSPYGARLRSDQSNQRARLWKNIVRGAAIVGGPMAATAAIPALAGAGAASGAASAGAAAAPEIASVGTAAGLPWLRLSEIGVGAGMNLLGMRSANKAGDRAAQIEEAAALRQEAMLQKQFELEKAAFEADQEQKRLDRLAADEERAFTRQTFEDKEARRGPYRQMSQGAMIALGNIAGIHLNPSPVTPRVMPDGMTAADVQRAPVSRAYRAPVSPSRRLIAPAGSMSAPSRLISLSQVR